jgi:hypothetical protein
MNNTDGVVLDIPEDLIPYLDGMLLEMDECRLEVCLIPSQLDLNGKIRAATGQNPVWYQVLCTMYLRAGCTKAKVQTIIKRQHTMRILEWMIERRYSTSKYAEYLMDVARDRQEFHDQMEKNDGLKPWSHQF